MTGTRALVWSSIQPVLAGTAFDHGSSSPPADEEGHVSAQVLWCAAAEAVVRRHPAATGAADVDHPDGCVDLVIDVDARGRLDSAWMECLDLDDGLVGLPIDRALPVLAERIATLLG